MYNGWWHCCISEKRNIYEVFDSDCVCSDDIELRVVKLSINGNKKQILIVAYRPPGGNVANAINALSSCVEKFGDRYSNTEYVILGDLNINYLNKKSCQVKLLKGLEKQFSLTKVIEEPTRVTPGKNTLIDLLTNMKNLLSKRNKKSKRNAVPSLEDVTLNTH